MDDVIIFGAKFLFAFVILLAFIAWLQANKKVKKEIILAGIAAVFVAVLLDKICSKLYYDPRPFVTQSVKPLINHAADNGFPSEHTLFSITLATIVFLYRPKLGLLAFAVAILVGLSRVAAHVHSPIDIIGGVVIGLLAGWCGYSLANKVLSENTPQTRKSQDSKKG